MAGPAGAAGAAGTYFSLDAAGLSDNRDASGNGFANQAANQKTPGGLLNESA